MKVEITYLGKKFEVELDILITSITIQSDQLAEVDFLIRIPTHQFRSTLSFLSEITSFRDDAISINEISFKSDTIINFFNGHFITNLIEATIEKGSQKFSASPLRSFELFESLDSKSLMLSNTNRRCEELQIQSKLKIQRGNRFNQVYKSSIPFVNFVHFCLKDFLSDRDYQLSTLPSQYVTQYQTSHATLFEVSFLDSLQQRCKQAGVGLTVSQFYKPELEDSLKSILSAFSQLLGKELVLTTKDDLKQSTQPVEGVVVSQQTLQAAQQQLQATVQTMQALQATFNSLSNAPSASDLNRIQTPPKDGNLDLSGASLSAASGAEPSDSKRMKTFPRHGELDLSGASLPVAGASTSPLVAAVQKSGVASTRAPSATNGGVRTNDQYQHLIPFSGPK